MSESVEGYAKSNVRLSKLVKQLRKSVYVLTIERDSALAKIEELEDEARWWQLSKDPTP